MGSRIPDSGIDLMPSGRLRLWTGCEVPFQGPAYHTACRPLEEVTVAEWMSIRRHLQARNGSGFVTAILATPAGAWWTRTAPILRAAWAIPTAAPAMWHAPTAPGPTEWVGPSPVFHF